MIAAKGPVLRGLRVASLVVAATLCLTVLMRFAPGYFSDSRELDAEHGAAVRDELRTQQQEGSMANVLIEQWSRLSHGNLGQSRQNDLPVTRLIAERSGATVRLLLSGVLCGWTGALALALPLALRRSLRGEMLVAAPVTLLLSIPVGAMATACMLMNAGGPVLVLSLLIGTRDFKVLYRLLRQMSDAPCVLFARSQGMPAGRIVMAYLLPAAGSEFFALAISSFAVALGACVPIEVILDVPGLGQLAWNAAMNRDLPVLTAVTILMAAAIGVVGIVSESRSAKEPISCA